MIKSILLFLILIILISGCATFKQLDETWNFLSSFQKLITDGECDGLKCTLADGSECEFEDDKLKCILANGSECEFDGEFQDGNPNGQLKCTLTDGSECKFDGEFQDGNPNGQLKCTSTDGSECEGTQCYFIFLN